MSKLDTLFAFRFLKARKRNKLLSFLSITSVVGVMLGVATLITVICVMDGFTTNLKTKFLGANPHIIVSNMDASPIKNWEKVVADISKMKNVTGVAPFILGQGMITNEKSVTGVVVRGIIPAEEKLTGGRGLIMTSGSLDDLKPADGSRAPTVILGKEMLLSLGVKMGDSITLISPSGMRGAFGLIPKMHKFKVAGFFDTGMYEYNRSLIYIHLKEAQNFYMLGSSVSAISVMTSNPDDAAEVAVSVQKELNKGDGFFWARDWLSMNSTLFGALKLEQYALFVILTLIIIVASFNIVSMITVTVKDKRKDVAILRAMGGSEKLIRRIFVRQGLIIGAMGTLLGNLVALILGIVLKNTKIIEVPKELYFSDTIPITIAPHVYIIVTVCALIITYVAAVIPARISARVDPIEAMRNE